MTAAPLPESSPQMKPSDAIKGKTDEIRKIIKSYGFVAPGIFGSTARGEDREGSDLDLLATIPDHMAGQISLFDIANLQDELELMLGVVVDFNVENNMLEIYRASIELEMIKL
jgi:predicted nucleotidyltransferase